jgi:hypothetical protein
VHEEREAIGAGVVDQHVERPERLHGRGDALAGRRGVGHVHPHGEAVDLARHVPRARLVDVGDRDPRALGGQPPDRGRPDPRRAAGDQRDPSFEPHTA